MYSNLCIIYEKENETTSHLFFYLFFTCKVVWVV